MQLTNATFTVVVQWRVFRLFVFSGVQNQCISPSQTVKIVVGYSAFTLWHHVVYRERCRLESKSQDLSVALQFWFWSLKMCVNMPNICKSRQSPGENSAMALRQLYSAESTCSLVSLSTWSWNTLTWSMKDTTRSADMGEEWNPAAASKGAMWSGRADWAALRMNSSLQLSLSRATCEFVHV